MDSQKPSGFADPVLAPTGPGRSNTGLHQAFYVAHSRLSSIWWIDTLVLWNSRFGMLKPLKPYKGPLERSGTCLWDEQRQQSCWSLRIWTALTSVFPLSQTFTGLQWFLMSLPTSSLSSQILVELCWLGFGAQTFPPCVTLFGMVGGQYDCNLKHSVPRVFMDFWPRWTIASMLSTWLSWSYALLSMECWCWRATGSSDIEHIRATSHFATRRTYGVTPVAGSKLRVKFDTFLVTVWCSVWDSGQGSLTNHMNHVFQTNAFAKFAMNCNECVAPLAAWRCGLAWRDLRPQPWTSSWIWCRLLKSWTRWCSCLGSGIPWDSMGFHGIPKI